MNQLIFSCHKNDIYMDTPPKFNSLPLKGTFQIGKDRLPTTMAFRGENVNLEGLGAVFLNVFSQMFKSYKNS